MDATEALNLYDSFWFEMNILKTRSTTSPPTMASMYMQIQKQAAPPPEISNLRATRGGQSTIFRSMSEDLYTKPSFNNTPGSPDSVLPSQFRTILSGKEVTGEELELFTNYSSPPPPPPPPPPKSRKATPGRRRAGKKGAGSKSLSSLEFEEVKGFMDLGFVFSEEDKDSSLISILPGLQRLGEKKVERAGVDESGIPRRPYLSEAWGVEEEKRNPVMNWRVRALGSEIDMKDSLRLWAHTVASTVR